MKDERLALDSDARNSWSTLWKTSKKMIWWHNGLVDCWRLSSWHRVWRNGEKSLASTANAGHELYWMNVWLVLARNIYIRQQGECMRPTAIAVWLPEHFFEQFEAASEVRLLLPELFPGSCGAPRVAVAVPCTRITVHKFCSTTALRCYSGVWKYDFYVPKKITKKANVTGNCFSDKNVIKHTLCFSQKKEVKYFYHHYCSMWHEH